MLCTDFHFEAPSPLGCSIWWQTGPFWIWCVGKKKLLGYCLACLYNWFVTISVSIRQFYTSRYINFDVRFIAIDVCLVWISELVDFLGDDNLSRLKAWEKELVGIGYECVYSRRPPSCWMIQIKLIKCDFNLIIDGKCVMPCHQVMNPNANWNNKHTRIGRSRGIFYLDLRKNMPQPGPLQKRIPSATLYLHFPFYRFGTCWLSFVVGTYSTC